MFSQLKSAFYNCGLPEQGLNMELPRLQPCRRKGDYVAQWHVSRSVSESNCHKSNTDGKLQTQQHERMRHNAQLVLRAQLQ